MENFGLPPATMRKRIEEVLDQMGINELRQRRISTLSGGEKQRVAIAAVLALQPQILVLDEPTSQLDPQAAEEVLIALRQINEDQGLTVILSEHRLERVAQYVDRILHIPALGAPPALDEPRSVMAQLPLVPPLVELGRRLGWEPLPLTIKEARPFARRIAPKLATQVADSAGTAVPQNQPLPPAQPVIAVRNVHYSYHGHRALRGVNLNVRPGEFLALMGRNGSGKSTLLKALVGLLKPDEGEVTVAAMNTKRVDVDALIRHVGYVPQHPGSLLFSDTLAQELAFTRRSHAMPSDSEGDLALLDRLGLRHAADRDPRDLSGGEQQRAALAAILVAQPQILLLDEPTRGLDYVQKRSLADLLLGLKAEGRTVVMATHDVELAAACVDRVALMGEGQIVVDGPAREIMSDSQVFASQINKLFRDPQYLIVGDVLASLGLPIGSEPVPGQR
jgi:energy-coupling factor transport system ATP-binding protein